QGFAIAQAALDAGAEVTLICGQYNETLNIPYGCQFTRVGSAREMLTATMQASASADVLIMSAAVADFRPVQAAPQKIKKEQGAPLIQLEANPDILKEVGSRKKASGFPRKIIGFAAESENLIKNATSKLQSKGADLFVANDISSSQTGFEVDLNQVTFLSADGLVEKLPVLSKTEVAEKLIEKVVEWF
ncbi:MAG: bifunctional 4'-phosphopantothenoylcysteine decarboxylase/phosphopantothenoylcysteine synthetase, partial [Anaerolineae bacterium]|nr:bifunctional 4'-phosphopantothenoylcysteine decarboxylase/phosphopantothenoylcysteine synthetase [Anaerolineae bacterium]